MANDFSGDSNCVALWRFEDDALLVDSKDSNTLQLFWNPVDESLADFKEGTCAASVDNATYKSFMIPDDDLAAGFPLKDGDTNKKISVCGWFKFDSLINNEGPFGKADTGDGTVSVRPLYIASSGRWYSSIGYFDGTNQSEVLYQAPEPGPAAVTGRWYHFGFTFDDSDKSWKLVIWDDSDSTKVVNTNGYATNNIYVATASVRVGCSFSFAETDAPGAMDGLIDEMVVFNDILTLPQIDAIRAGTYPNTIESGFWPVISRLLDQQKQGA